MHIKQQTCSLSCDHSSSPPIFSLSTDCVILTLHTSKDSEALQLKRHWNSKGSLDDPWAWVSYLFVPEFHKDTHKVTWHRWTQHTHTHAQIQHRQMPSRIKNKHMNTDGFQRQSLSSNWEILIKSKLWARLESLPSLLMRACCLWNVSLQKHSGMQMRVCFNKDFITCSIFLVTLHTWRLTVRACSISTLNELHVASLLLPNYSHVSNSRPTGTTMSKTYMIRPKYFVVNVRLFFFI